MQQTYKATSTSRGQALVEVLIALGITVVGILAAVTLLSKSLLINRLTTERNTATYLALETIEVVKNMADAQVVKGCTWGAGGLQGFNAGQYVASYDIVLNNNCATQQLVNVTPSTRQVVRLNIGVNAGMYVNRAGGGGFDATPYTRIVQISYPAGIQAMDVSSVVTWNSTGGALQSVTMHDRFYNWRP